MKKISSKLDWTRMLGFDQIADDRLAIELSGGKLARVGSKVGEKVGAKMGLKS